MDTIKEFFTDDQWDAIDRAMADFQDYGEEEAETVSYTHLTLPTNREV